MDQMVELVRQLGEAAIRSNACIATGESCTGGLVAQLLTSVSGSSAWFDCGFVTYSNQAKTTMLGVLPATIVAYGAVSEQVVTEMACGVLANSQANLAVSISGIAGPLGGTEDKPVGTVCFAWARPQQSAVVTTQYFTGDRQAVREQAAMYAILGLLEMLG